jgi:hypothetical protein
LDLEAFQKPATSVIAWRSSAPYSSIILTMSWPRLSERAKIRLSGLVSFIALLPMFFLGNQVWMFVHAVWNEHWVRKDCMQVSAVVTHVGSKEWLDYQYTVNGRDYIGNDRRDWEDERDHPAAVGGKITAFVSSSHPWLSELDLSRSAWIGLPFVLLILLIELFMLGVLIDGILRLLFGIAIHNGKPEGSIIVLMFAGALVVFLITAILGMRRNRRMRFFVTRR